MKKTIYFILGILITSTIVLTSCKKETRIEKNLSNKGGEWNIESLIANQKSTNPIDNFNETIYNYGTITFKKDGTGSYTITVDGDFEAGSLTFSNTEKELSLIINNQKRVFDIVEWKKDKMKISITENFSSNGESISYTETLNLKKK
jgi:hypothetical protein